MFIHIVRFKSRLPATRVLELYESRLAQYRHVLGLIQKYYLHYAETDEHGAVYLWQSKEALDAFRKSELGRSIGNVYEVESTDLREGEVVLTAHPV